MHHASNMWIYYDGYDFNLNMLMIMMSVGCWQVTLTGWHHVPPECQLEDPQLLAQNSMHHPHLSTISMYHHGLSCQLDTTLKENTGAGCNEEVYLFLASVTVHADFAYGDAWSCWFSRHIFFHFYPGHGPVVQGQNTVLTSPNLDAFLIGATE